VLVDGELEQNVKISESINRHICITAP